MWSRSMAWFPFKAACNVKIHMVLTVGNGYGRSAVPGFVVLKGWAQRYAAANSPNMTE